MTTSRLSTRRMVYLLAVAAGAALIAVPSAQAANMVPNPTFQDSCSGVPCHWSGEGGATFVVSGTQPHSGSTSGLLTLATAGMVGGSAQSDCLPVTAGTTYNMAIWYRAPAALAGKLTRISFSPFFYPDANCDGGAVDQSAPGAFTNSPNTDGSWHELTGTATATSILFTPQSANLVIGLLCAPSFCPVGQAAWFDDAQMDTSPLAVTLYDFRAARSHGGVTLRWRTGTEADTLGFNVFRQQGSRRVRVNRRLLPALGGLGGSSYSFADRRAPRHRAVRYWLQDVDTHSVRTWHGPVRVRAA
jgi:hypothetical protein